MPAPSARRNTIDGVGPVIDGFQLVVLPAPCGEVIDAEARVIWQLLNRLAQLPPERRSHIEGLIEAAWKEVSGGPGGSAAEARSA